MLQKRTQTPPSWAQCRAETTLCYLIKHGSCKSSHTTHTHTLRLNRLKMMTVLVNYPLHSNGELPTHKKKLTSDMYFHQHRTTFWQLSLLNQAQTKYTNSCKKAQRMFARNVKGRGRACGPEDEARRRSDGSREEHANSTTGATLANVCTHHAKEHREETAKASTAKRRRKATIDARGGR